MTQAVIARGLGREFSGRWVVPELDLQVPKGSFFGLLGPNGAGKTTTLRMLTGLLRPSRGLAFVEGVDVWAEPSAAKARIGVLPEDVPLFDRLTARELLEYHGLLRSMPVDVIETRAGELLDVLDLTSAGAKLVADFSHGMRKKVGLASALLHNPRVLFLDEPFEAIDPVSARTIRGVLQRYTAAGGTVLFSSHVLAVVEQICTHVAVIAEGRLVLEGTLEEIVGANGSLEDAFVSSVGALDLDGTELAWLGSSSA